MQKWHEEGDFDSGDLYNLCGFDAEELGVPELENSQYSSNWTRLFHMQMLQYGITCAVVILAAPSLLVDDKRVVNVAFGCLFGWSCEAIGALVVQALWMYSNDGKECALSTNVNDFETGGTFEETGSSM